MLEWIFIPADYFEESLKFSHQHFDILVDSGRASAQIPADIYPLDHSLRNQLHQELDARFLAAQVLNHKPYRLSQPSVSRLYQDGRRDVWLFVEPATLKISGGAADLILRDASGNVIHDSRRERIDNKIELSQRVAQYIDDPVVKIVLRSYSAAVNDPKNELVHLYEIRDALSKHLGGEVEATAVLGVSSTQWSRLGNLANNCAQGRHRGKQLGTLRDATAAELSEARKIAQMMIEGYLQHLRNRDDKGQ